MLPSVPWGIEVVGGVVAIVETVAVALRWLSNVCSLIKGWVLIITKSAILTLHSIIFQC